jgi:hypothetical protein
MLGANRIVRAKASEFDCVAEVLVDLAPNLNEAAQCSLRIRRARVKQDAVAGVAGVDPLSNRGRGVAALQRYLRDEQVCERVQHYIGGPDKLRLRIWVLLLPQLEAFGQFEFPFRDFTSLTPGANFVRLERDEDALAAIFHGRNPADFISQRGAIHANRKLTIYVIRGRFKSCEPDQRNYFAHTVDQDDTIELLPDRAEWRCGAPAACVEIAFDIVLTDLVGAGKQSLNFRLLDGLC